MAAEVGEDTGNQLVAWLCLQEGTINPIQWLTSIFMHAEPLHLIGNMIFVWAFGLIVEGKANWWRFLLIYLGIGMLDSAIWQLLLFPMSSGGFFDNERFALGASGAVFGLMAVALMWAPENELNVILFICYLPLRFTTTVRIFVAISAGLEILYLFLTGFALTGTVAHVIGFASGIGIGIALIKWREVDCEGYDFISCWRGEEGGVAQLTREQEREQKQAEEDKKQREHEEAMRCYAAIDKLLANQMLDAAIGRYNLLKKSVPSASWRRDQLYAVIRLLLQAKRYREAIDLMTLYVLKFQELRDAVKLQLAHVHLVHDSRPLKAKRVVESVDRQQLSEKQQKQLEAIIKQAQQQLDEGAIDFQDD